MANMLLQFQMSDFTPFDNAKVYINGNWKVVSGREKNILILACKTAERAMMSIDNSDGRKPLIVNINSRGGSVDKNLVDWDFGYVQGFVGALEVADIKYDGKLYDVKITIKSRFDGDKPFFLSYMLSQGDNLLHDWSVELGYDDLFDFLLVSVFAINLKRAAKQGLYRTYQVFEKNDNRPKGTINFSDHIKFNTGTNNGKIAYSHRENTCDNSLNHLILHAYKHLKFRFSKRVLEIIKKDSGFNKIIINIRENATSFPRTNVRGTIAKSLRPIAHPYYCSYEKLRHISLLILRNRGISVFGREREKVQGILYYIPDLWERCISNALLKVTSRDKIQEQPLVKVMGNSTYPDFILDIGNRKIVLDAKFKPNWFDAVINGKRKNSIVLRGQNRPGRSYNLWEDYNKCIRDMDACNTNETGVIFPCSKSQFNDCNNFYGHDSYTQEQNPICLVSSYRRSEEQKGRFYCYAVYIPETDLPIKYNTYNAWRLLMEKQLGATATGIMRQM
ncbi:MAG TPA: hypothetical protein VFD17_07260 [Clostridia bacterium]|nr:hypothetical protein [Clostridia bacterium]